MKRGPSGARRAEPAVADHDPPVDHAHLARYTFGNRALEIEVLTLFADQAPDYLAAMRNARSEKEWRDAAHTLKGSARAVGAMRVAAAALASENVPFPPHPTLKEKVVGDLARALAEARAHIATLQAAEDAAPGTERPPSPKDHPRR